VRWGARARKPSAHTTQDYIIRLANERVEDLIRKEPPYQTTLNMCSGKWTNAAAAEPHGMVAG